MEILLVEDDDSVREAIAYLLEEKGYKAVQARDGAEALTFLKTGRADPCLILLDLFMPNMNGYEFLEHVGKDDVLVTIPVVVVSAAARLPAPTNRPFVKKPIDLKELMKYVDQYCKKEPDSV